mgnify:CR=1 FL=1
MKNINQILTIFLAIGLIGANTDLLAHGPGPDDSMDGLMVTRHFTGAWDQPDQETQDDIG